MSPFAFPKNFLRERETSLSLFRVSLIWGLGFTEESGRERERAKVKIFSQKVPLANFFSSAPVFQKGGP